MIELYFSGLELGKRPYMFARDIVTGQIYQGTFDQNAGAQSFQLIDEKIGQNVKLFLSDISGKSEGDILGWDTQSGKFLYLLKKNSSDGQPTPERQFQKYSCFEKDVIDLDFASVVFP